MRNPLADERRKYGLLPCLMLLFSVSRGTAHNISVSYAEIHAEHHSIQWLLRVPLPELDLLLSLDLNRDGNVDSGELHRRDRELIDYFRRNITVEQRIPLPASSVEIHGIWRDADQHEFVEAAMAFDSEQTLDRARLRSTLLDDVVSGHQTIATIETGGKSTEFVFEAQNGYQIDQRSTSAAIFQFVQMGVMHIFTGYDHLAFLLGIILIGGTFGRIVKIVTSFTVAHSITLALAVLGLVKLPSRLIESGIALSIIYIAIENLFFKRFDRRWMVTFFFGLIHGFGFAGALNEMNLSRERLGVALFSFNLGVELGQVCIVAVLVPILWRMQNKPYHELVVKAVSVAIFVAGSFWLLQRLTG